MALKNRFPAFANSSFRAFWFAQAVSLPGTWMQNLALPWLAYTLTGSPFLLGLVGAVQFLPVMLLSLFAGALTDRLEKAKVVFVTQLVLTLGSGVLAVLVFTHTATYPILLAMALVLGLANTLDMPSRQSMVGEIVGKELVMNAVALNSSLFNAARIVGPALAGLVMGAWGIGWCFALNSLSFLPLLFVLPRLPKHPAPARTDTDLNLWNAVKEGVNFVRHTRDIREVLVAVGIMGVLGFNFSVLLPVLVKQTLGQGETTYGLLMSFMGVGSLTAALTIAARSKHGPRKELLVALPFVTMVLFVGLAFAPWFWLIAGLMVLVGFTNITFFTTANSYLQMNSPPEFRGRVISFYSLLFGGTTPLGNLIAGSLAEAGGATLGFLVTGLLLGASFLGVRVTRAKAGSKAPPPSPLP